MLLTLDTVCTDNPSWTVCILSLDTECASFANLAKSFKMESEGLFTHDAPYRSGGCKLVMFMSLLIIYVEVMNLR